MAGFLRLMHRAVHQNFAAVDPTAWLSGIRWFILAIVVLCLLGCLSYLGATPQERARGRARARRVGAAATALNTTLSQFEVYSADPVVARRAMVTLAQQELRRQREQQAQTQEEALRRQLALRARDEADEERRMRLLAAAMIDEMEARARRRAGA